MIRKENPLWHSSAQAETLEDLYPGVKLGIGRNVDNGFYYDIDLGNRVLSTEDLPKIEKENERVGPVRKVSFFTDKICLNQMYSILHR